MTTNDLPTPAAWIDKDGGTWPLIEGRTIEGLTTDWPDSAPFVPVYRADDLSALVLPEVTDEDAIAARGTEVFWAFLSPDVRAEYLRRAQAVRDLLASRMHKPTLADVLPGAPDLGEGEWAACDDECARTDHAHGLSLWTDGGECAHWCFVPATPPDPDADAKAVLSDAWHRTSAEEPAEILDTLRAAGWELVRKEGER